MTIPRTTGRRSPGATAVLVRLTAEEAAALDALAARYGTATRPDTLRAAAEDAIRRAEDERHAR